MIGVNAAVRIGAQGIGFAIPIDRAIEVAANMIAEHRQSAGSSHLEVKTEYRDGRSWVRVLSGPSGELLRNDVIRQVDQRPIKNRMDYELALIGLPSERGVPMLVERNGETLTASVRLPATGQIARNGSGARFVSTSSDSIQDRVYRDLGLKLEVADRSKVRAVDSNYQGGMLVVAVRPDSLAASAPIQKGDILVGLMGWQTTSWNDVSYIMNTDEMSSEATPEFRIIRGAKLYWSNLELGSPRVR